MADTSPAASLPLADVQLGDVVVLPDGRAMTARARVSLPVPCGSMAGFVIVGEMDALLSTPPTANGPVAVYVPIGYVPSGQVRPVHEGVARYWAPHLPALGGAMGEIAYRVMEVRGSVDPIVCTWRSGELIVFIRASYARGSDLQLMRMARGVDNEVALARHSALVTQPVPATEEVPIVPAHTLYETFTR